MVQDIFTALFIVVAVMYTFRAAYKMFTSRRNPKSAGCEGCSGCGGMRPAR